VAQQPWAARTAIIVSADHGEVFGEHGMYRHGFEVWQELVRVAWMFVLPGGSARRIDANRSHLDMAPTILDLLGVSHEPMEGTSLVPELYGRAEPEPRDVIVDLPRTSDSDRRRALVHDHYKLIAFGDDSYFRLFDLDADPGEEKPIEKTDRAKLDEMLALYREAAKGIKDVGPYACRTLKGAPPGRAF
jgi:arylsulfatase A-like enzyme